MKTKAANFFALFFGLIWFGGYFYMGIPLTISHSRFDFFFYEISGGAIALAGAWMLNDWLKRLGYP